MEFGRIGRQRYEGDVVGDSERGGDVIASAVENERSMAARGDLAADGGEMQRHRFGIGRRQDQACRDAALRTGGAEQIGPIVPSIARCARTAIFEESDGVAPICPKH
jgi:hypothetical protein